MAVMFYGLALHQVQDNRVVDFYESWYAMHLDVFTEVCSDSIVLNAFQNVDVIVIVFSSNTFICLRSNVEVSRSAWNSVPNCRI